MFFEIVYFNMIVNPPPPQKKAFFFFLFFFAVTCCQMCHHAGGEKTASFPAFLKVARQRGKPHVMNGGNLQSVTLY